MCCCIMMNIVECFTCTTNSVLLQCISVGVVHPEKSEAARKGQSAI